MKRFLVININSGNTRFECKTKEQAEKYAQGLSVDHSGWYAVVEVHDVYVRGTSAGFNQPASATQR